MDRRVGGKRVNDGRLRDGERGRYTAVREAAAALSGVVAGTTIDRSVVQLAAWRRLGADPWAVYTREELRCSLVWYPPLGIGTALINIGAAVAVHRDGEASRSSALLSRAVAILAIGHLLATAKATPNMVRVRETEDPDSLREG